MSISKVVMPYFCLGTQLATFSVCFSCNMTFWNSSSHLRIRNTWGKKKRNPWGERLTWPLSLGMLIKLAKSGIWAWTFFKSEETKIFASHFFASNRQPLLTIAASLCSLVWLVKKISNWCARECGDIFKSRLSSFVHLVLESIASQTLMCIRTTGIWLECRFPGTVQGGVWASVFLTGSCWACDSPVAWPIL